MSTGKGHVHIDTGNSGLWLRLGLRLSVRVVEMRGVVTCGEGRVVMIGGFCDRPFRGGGPGTTCDDGGCSKLFSGDMVRVHIRTKALVVRDIHIYVIFFLGDIFRVDKSPFLVFTGLHGCVLREVVNTTVEELVTGPEDCSESNLRREVRFPVHRIWGSSDEADVAP